MKKKGQLQNNIKMALVFIEVAVFLVFDKNEINKKKRKFTKVIISKPFTKSYTKLQSQNSIK